MTNRRVIELMGNSIKSYPIVFGVLVAVILSGIVIVIETWFPRIGEAWDRNNSFVLAGWCTAVFFLLCIARYWPLRRRFFFWVSILAFFVAHCFAVFYYARLVKPLGTIDWIVLLIAESLAFILYIGWLTRRFERAGKNHRRDG
jgi:hypothetical protein